MENCYPGNPILMGERPAEIQINLILAILLQVLVEKSLGPVGGFVLRTVKS